jgi:hypothetical protein
MPPEDPPGNVITEELFTPRLEFAGVPHFAQSIVSAAKSGYHSLPHIPTQCNYSAGFSIHISAKPPERGIGRNLFLMTSLFFSKLKVISSFTPTTLLSSNPQAIAPIHTKLPNTQIQG